MKLLEDYFHETNLELRDPGRPAEDLHAVDGATHEPGPLYEPDETIPNSFKEIRTNLFELFAADLAIQVQVIRQTLDDDR